MKTTNTAGDTVYFEQPFVACCLNDLLLNRCLCHCTQFYILPSSLQHLLLRRATAHVDSLTSTLKSTVLLRASWTPGGWEEDETTGWGCLPPTTMAGNKQKRPGVCAQAKTPIASRKQPDTHTRAILAQIVPVGVALSPSTAQQIIESWCWFY